MLELARGTGLWMVELARHADSVTAVEAYVRYVEADLFDRCPDAAYDAVFFGFWLSHLPPERFGGFWELARSATGPGGRGFFVNSLGPGTSDEKGRCARDPQDHTTIRQVEDGRESRIVKVFYDPEALEGRLTALKWRISARTTEHLLHGSGELLA